MKFSVSLSAILAILPALALAASPLDSRALSGDVYFPRHHARHFGRQRQGAFGGNHTKQGQQGAGANGTRKSKSSTSVAAPSTIAAVATSSAAQKAAATTTTAATGRGRGGNKNKNGGGNTSISTTSVASETASGTSSAAAATTSDATASIADNSGNNSDPNTAPTLLASLVATGLELTGQETPTAGQVASLTSKNNFINFCIGKTITNGQQITGGSCDPIPMGDIIPKANMPSSKFKNPTNFSKIPANQPFTIQMVLKNLQAGVFTNAQKTYYMAPQQLNGQKVLIGHTHVVIQPMGDFASGDILDPSKFTFFKGINVGQDGSGVVSADVTAGVPPGNYRLASINTDSNHAPAVVAVAQHGCLDDMIYFTAE